MDEQAILKTILAFMGSSNLKGKEAQTFLVCANYLQSLIRKLEKPKTPETPKEPEEPKEPEQPKEEVKQ